MNKLIKGVKRLALALCLATPFVSRAGLPTITVNGNDVTISFDSGSYGNIGTNNGGSDTITIPAATDLDSGTVLLIKSISLGSRDSGTASPASITVAGVNSDVAVVTDDVYGTNRDKYTYNFSSPCLVKVGTASSVSYKNANGEQVNVGLAAALITEAPDSYVFGLNSYSFNQTHTWGILSEIVAEKVTGYINETANGFNTTVTTDKLYVSGLDGYLNTIDAFGFGTVDELVVVDGEYTYGYKVVNGNSPQNNDTKCNRAVAFKKLSGTGTITNGDHGNGPTPVMGVCDSSEFAGSINIGSATTRLSVLFCTEAEISAGIQTSLGDSLFNLFAGQSTRSRIYVSAGRTTANNAVVTVPSGKTWTAVNGITNKGELVVDGTVSCNIVNDGTLTVNGTVTGTISGTGTVVVNEGASVPSFGSQRDFTGWTVDESVPVKITMTSEEYGKGSVSVTGASGISSITVFAPDGTTEVGAITPEAGAGTLETGVNVSGKACWYAWEMNGNLNGSGANTAGLSHDTGSSDQNAFYNSSMLYTYRHPYTTVAFPANWTAVVRCTVPKVVNGTVITFGTKFTSFIGLIAGDDPETEMKLVRYNAGDEAYSVLASIPIVDGTSAQHVYIFSVENNSAVKVYCDGSVVLDQTFDAFSLGGGIQIGSAHGGVAGGLVRMWAGDTYAGLTTADLEEARIDCVRLYDYSLSAEQVAALSTEFPSVTIYRATVADEANTTWDDLSWEPSWTGGNNLSKVILTTECDATVALPETITADQLQFVLAADSTLTLAGPGSLTVTEPVDIGNGTLELTGTVTLTRNTAFNGTVKFTEFTKAGDGAIQLSNGATVGVDAALVVTPLGTYTCAEGTVVDSVYTGDGVKLIPLASAKASLTYGGETYYYSTLDDVFTAFMQAAGQDDTAILAILDGTDYSESADQFATYGYLYDATANTLVKATAKIYVNDKWNVYSSLTDAVAAVEDGGTVYLQRASSEEITLNKEITLSETANFSGTLSGSGTLTFAKFRNNPSITFDNWTGTVVLPSFTAGGTIFNKYGVTGSTVVLKGIDSGWLGETGTQRMDVAPTLQLDGDVTITGFSTSWDYTFAEITGTGTFALDPANNHPKSATINKVAEGFTGTVYTDIDTTLTIGTLAREAGTSTEPDTLLLSTDGTGDVVVEAVTIGGEPADVYLVYEEDGVYVGVPPVEINPSAVVINYNSYATLSVVGGSLEGATYGWTMYTNNVACSSLQGPVKIADGKKKATVKVYSETMAFDNVVAKVAITNGEEVIEREATITVADVAAKIGETEYTKAELNDAIAAAIESGNVLEHYLSVSTTISKGQTLKTKKLAERNGSATVKAAASTVEGEAWTVAKSEEDGVITWSVATETPYFEFTSTDSQTVEYLASPKNASGVNKLLSDVTLTKQFSVTTDGVVLDLNGHALTSTYSSTTAGAIYVNVISPAPAALTVKDSVGGGSIAAASAHSVFNLGNNGQLTIEGGSFTGKHIVYGTKVTSKATITGGTFAATDAGFTLNMLDTARGTITVTGGTFTGFNPANNSAEGAGTNFVPKGYVSSETSAGVWTVTEVTGIDPESTGNTPLDVDPTATQEEAQDAADALEVNVTSEVEAVLETAEVSTATYQSYFTKTAVFNDVAGAWEVQTTIAETVTEDVNEDAVAKLIAAVEDTEATTVSVAVPAGLFYKVETFDALGGDPVDTKTGLSTGVTTPATKPTGTTKGFIRVTVGAAEIQ